MAKNEKFQVYLDPDRRRWLRAEAKRRTAEVRALPPPSGIGRIPGLAPRVTMSDVLRAAIDGARYQQTITTQTEAGCHCPPDELHNCKLGAGHG